MDNWHRGIALGSTVLTVESDELSVVFDAAYPSCPVCGERLEVAGPVEAPHLVCDYCDVRYIGW